MESDVSGGGGSDSRLNVVSAESAGSLLLERQLSPTPSRSPQLPTLCLHLPSNP